jgi:hypothetical protein
MEKVNYYLALTFFGEQFIGRTDYECSTMHRVNFPDGTPGRIIVAPAVFVESFRAKWIDEYSWSASDIMHRSFWLTKTAILAWDDKQRASLLS